MRYRLTVLDVFIVAVLTHQILEPVTGAVDVVFKAIDVVILLAMLICDYRKL